MDFRFKHICFIRPGSLLLLAFSCLAFSCQKANDRQHSPEDIFNETWKVIDERYALFAVKNISWDSIYTVYKPRFSNSMSQTELARNLDNMLQELKDGHIALITDADTSLYTGFYKLHPRNFNYANVRKNYLLNDYQTAGPLIYKVVGETGYIYYGSFAASVTDQQMETIIKALKDLRGIIIDVRGNFGGDLRNVQRFASRFIQQRELIKYELVKRGAGHGDFHVPQPFYLSQASSVFTGKIIILANRSCFSACNDFVLYLSDNANVQLVGDSTGGGGGIPYQYVLQNGWVLQYTATKTLSASGNAVESGLPPHINISILPSQEAAGIDPILEKAIELLR